MQAWRGELWSLVSPTTSALSISGGWGWGGMKGSICRRGTVQSRSLDQVGDQVADGGTAGHTGGASEGHTHLFDSGIIQFDCRTRT